MQVLEKMLQDTPYVSYTYAYPHKTAYRPFPSPLPLDQVWSGENRQATFLYIHVPFCEMRCGFCNLFTTTNPALDFITQYLDTLQRQAKQVRAQLSDISIARMAIGGGTPTFLEPRELTRLFTIAEQHFGVVPGHIPTSVETSPLTSTPDRLQILREHGIDRVSIGVQSFLEAEVRDAGRSQKTVQVERALDAIRAAGFPSLNIDLIYGLPGQTVVSWLRSLEMALCYKPEELYLYPLYVRPLTGLARSRHSNSWHDAPDTRLECYRTARDLLLERGYTQVSMRMFRALHAPVESGPVYCVQEDGMIGLGCGARSYTRAHHYSQEYAVSARGVHAILAEYIATSTEAFASAHYGFQLDGDEQHRRYVLKSLLETGGLDLIAYHRHFNTDAFTDLPTLHDLLKLDLAHVIDNIMTLTPAGLERSDTIGPWLYSPHVCKLMEEYEIQ